MVYDHPVIDMGNSSQVAFHKVGECLYRLESTGGYYALVKRGGKQFRRSLKTADRKLAERRLADVRQKVNRLTCSDDSSLSFDDLATGWIELTAGELKPRSVERRLSALKGLAPFFRATSISQRHPRPVRAVGHRAWVGHRGINLRPRTICP